MERLSESLPPVVVRQRNAILGALLTLAVVGWVVVIDRAGRPMSMDRGLTMGSAALFFSMWVAMMVAMMFPAAAPMVLMYGRMKRNDPVSVGIFTACYLALWIAFGAIAFGLATLIEHLVTSSALISENWARGGGVLVVLAGVYQLTPLKDLCLRHCRSPLSFVMTYWRDGRGGAARMGVRHAVYCIGCCWLLFLVLVPLGVMNVAAMIAVTLVVFAEKVLPWGRAIARGAAPLMLAFGAAVAVWPALLPTTV